MTLGFSDTAYAKDCTIPDWADPEQLEYEYFIGVTGPARMTMRFDFTIESQADPNNLDQWDIAISTDSEFVEIFQNDDGDYVMEMWFPYPDIYYFNVTASAEETEWSEAVEVNYSGVVQVRKHKPQIGLGCREYEFYEDGTYKEINDG